MYTVTYLSEEIVFFEKNDALCLWRPHNAARTLEVFKKAFAYAHATTYLSSVLELLLQEIIATHYISSQNRSALPPPRLKHHSDSDENNCFFGFCMDRYWEEMVSLFGPVVEVCTRIGTSSARV